MKIATLVVLLGVLVAAQANAAPVTLTDGSSEVLIDPTSAAGVYSWSVGGTNHLSQQWFWFRANVTGWTGQEYPINMIGAPSLYQPSANYAQITYSESRFNAQVTYVLTDGGVGNSDLAEAIRLTNTSASPITFTLFQYSNFDLGGTATDQRVEVLDGNAVYQFDDVGGGSTMISETVVTSLPDLSEVGVLPTTLNKLQNATVDDLDGSTIWSTPGDLTWSFEWVDRTVAPGHSLIISKDKVLTTVVPEPAGLGLIGLALLAIRKRRS